MKAVFFIVGPTATGKSQLAADVAQKLGAEIISADAFQIYRGLDLLTAKPDPITLAKAPHHLIGTMPISDEMNAEKFRRVALQTLARVHSRGKLALVVGGSGLYVKALTHGLSPLPPTDSKLRAHLGEMSLNELRTKLTELDPPTAHRIDIKNRRRMIRAIEICVATGKPASTQRAEWSAVAGVDDPGQPASTMPATGVFVFRDRDELYARINRRVQLMFEHGLIEEVRTAGSISATASQMIGLREIRQLLAGKMSILQCMVAIQQATRRYAKRQLTWFRRQTNFLPLNLSLLSHHEAVTRISQLAEASAVAQGND
ncbi:MAG TPA: tRNA (adenosine(37)-N6)-dimethylallyltransferase MiaA [Chthoniobacterales bacterium]